MQLAWWFVVLIFSLQSNMGFLARNSFWQTVLILTAALILHNLACNNYTQLTEYWIVKGDRNSMHNIRKNTQYKNEWWYLDIPFDIVTATATFINVNLDRNRL